MRIEAQRLIKEENVTILIALGHSGYDLDMKMAAEIEELDVVVGGHSHTFLWPSKLGTNPSQSELFKQSSIWYLYDLIFIILKTV